jgi:hypothetical protein
MRRYGILLLPVLIWAAMIGLFSKPGRRLLSSRSAANPVILLLAALSLWMWFFGAAIVGLSTYPVLDYVRDRRRLHRMSTD